MKWYKRKQKNMEFYTHSPHQCTEHHPVKRNGVDIVNKLNELGPRAYSDNTGLYVSIEDVETVEPQINLPIGVYEHSFGSYSAGGDLPERLNPIKLRNDTYIEIESIMNPILQDLNNFISNREFYKKIGSVYKRGYLLYGPPGEGKSALIRNILSKKLSIPTIVIHLNNVPSRDFIEALASEDAMKVFVFEELAAAVTFQNIDSFLNFLDGELTTNNSIVFATTNYPERLPGNIVDRPSRFDCLLKLTNPNEEQRELLLIHYLSKEDVKDEVASTKALSTAAIKEACIISKTHNIEFKLAIAKLKKHHDIAKNDFGEAVSIGLSRED